MMKRLFFTLLVSVSSFAAIASFGAPDPRSDESAPAYRDSPQDQDGSVVIACQPGCAEDRLEEVGT